MILSQDHMNESHAVKTWLNHRARTYSEFDYWMWVYEGFRLEADWILLEKETPGVTKRRTYGAGSYVEYAK